jgi:hypothetical protein
MQQQPSTPPRNRKKRSGKGREKGRKEKRKA